MFILIRFIRLTRPTRTDTFFIPAAHIIRRRRNNTHHIIILDKILQNISNAHLRVAMFRHCRQIGKNSRSKKSLIVVMLNMALQISWLEWTGTDNVH